MPGKGKLKMNASDLFPPSEYLKSEDIEEAGGEMQLTIKSVGFKDYDRDDGSKDRRGILSFNELPKKLTVNATNTKTLVAMYGGKDIDKTWIGKVVILYVDPHVQYAGKEVKGIRIRLVDEKQDLVTAFWKKAREMGFTQQDGLDHVKQFGGDFKQALEALGNPF
jgi:hypothetical protein